MTVADRFQTLLSSIAVGNREVEDYAAHRQSVQQAIGAEYPGSECHVIGSHARGSAIGGTSDLDLLARLPLDAVRRSEGTAELVSSNTVLANVRARLDKRFRKTDSGRDGQAIVVSFANGTRDIDLVPAAFAGMVNVLALRAMRPSFWIADGRGSWTRTAPSAHNDYIARADRTAAGKLKYVAQLLRHWRRCRTPKIPMLTFHAELVLAQEGTCRGIRGYSGVLADCFAMLAARRGRPLPDPLGISGNVEIGSTGAKREDVVNALAFASDHAAKAVALESIGRLADAYAQWSIVFNGAFPSR